MQKHKGKENSMSIWKYGYKDTCNRYMTTIAIKELRYPTAVIPPIFTLETEDKDGLISLPKAYEKYYQDPTEYNFVKDYFDGNFTHWEEFKNSPKIRPVIEGLKKKNEKRLEAEAMAKIVNIAFDDSNKNNLAALKILVNDEKIKRKAVKDATSSTSDEYNKDKERLQEWIK